MIGITLALKELVVKKNKTKNTCKHKFVKDDLSPTNGIICKYCNKKLQA